MAFAIHFFRLHLVGEKVGELKIRVRTAVLAGGINRGGCQVEVRIRVVEVDTFILASHRTFHIASGDFAQCAHDVLLFSLGGRLAT